MKKQLKKACYFNGSGWRERILVQPQNGKQWVRTGHSHRQSVTKGELTLIRINLLFTNFDLTVFSPVLVFYECWTGV